MVEEECNTQILMNLPVTNFRLCVSWNANTLGLNIQFLDKAASSGPLNGACRITSLMIRSKLLDFLGQNTDIVQLDIMVQYLLLQINPTTSQHCHISPADQDGIVLQNVGIYIQFIHIEASKNSVFLTSVGTSSLT